MQTQKPAPRRPRRPSAATILAALALVVAVSGPTGAFAAVSKLITGKQIKNGTVTSKDIADSSLLSKDFKPGQLPAGERGPRGLPGAPGKDGVDGKDGADGYSPFMDVGYDFSMNPRATSSTTFMDVPSAAGSVTVPAGRTAVVVAHFSAESLCSGGSAGDECQIRVLLDGTPMQIDSEGASIFDSVDDGNSLKSAESKSIVRYQENVGPGTHTVQVQDRVKAADGANAPTMRLDNMATVVEAIEQG